MKYFCCQFCGTISEKLALCSDCHTASYCNSKCQGDHWSVHKLICKEAKKENLYKGHNDVKKTLKKYQQDMQNLKKQLGSDSRHDDFVSFMASQKITNNEEYMNSVYDFTTRENKIIFQMNFKTREFLRYVLFQTNASPKQIQYIESELIKHEKIHNEIYKGDTTNAKPGLFKEMSKHHENAWMTIHKICGLSPVNEMKKAEKVAAQIAADITITKTSIDASNVRNSFNSPEKIKGALSDIYAFAKDAGNIKLAELARQIANCFDFGKQNDEDVMPTYFERNEQEAGNIADNIRNRLMEEQRFNVLWMHDIADALEEKLMKENANGTDKKVAWETTIGVILACVVGYKYFVQWDSPDNVRNRLDSDLKQLGEKLANATLTEQKHAEDLIAKLDEGLKNETDLLASYSKNLQQRANLTAQLMSSNKLAGYLGEKLDQCGLPRSEELQTRSFDEQKEWVKSNPMDLVKAAAIKSQKLDLIDTSYVEKNSPEKVLAAYETKDTVDTSATTINCSPEQFINTEIIPIATRIFGWAKWINRKKSEESSNVDLSQIYEDKIEFIQRLEERLVEKVRSFTGAQDEPSAYAMLLSAIVDDHLSTETKLIDIDKGSHWQNLLKETDEEMAVLSEQLNLLNETISENQQKRNTVRQNLHDEQMALQGIFNSESEQIREAKDYTYKGPQTYPQQVMKDFATISTFTFASDALYNTLIFINQMIGTDISSFTQSLYEQLMHTYSTVGFNVSAFTTLSDLMQTAGSSIFTMVLSTQMIGYLFKYILGPLLYRMWGLVDMVEFVEKMINRNLGRDMFETIHENAGLGGMRSIPFVAIQGVNLGWGFLKLVFSGTGRFITLAGSVLTGKLMVFASTLSFLGHLLSMFVTVGGGLLTGFINASISPNTTGPAYYLTYVFVKGAGAIIGGTTAFLSQAFTIPGLLISYDVMMRSCRPSINNHDCIALMGKATFSAAAGLKIANFFTNRLLPHSMLFTAATSGMYLLSKYGAPAIFTKFISGKEKVEQQIHLLKYK